MGKNSIASQARNAKPWKHISKLLSSLGCMLVSRVEITVLGPLLTLEAGKSDHLNMFDALIFSLGFIGFHGQHPILRNASPESLSFERHLIGLHAGQKLEAPMGPLAHWHV